MWIRPRIRNTPPIPSADTPRTAWPLPFTPKKILEGTRLVTNWLTSLLTNKIPGIKVDLGTVPDCTITNVDVIGLMERVRTLTDNEATLLKKLNEAKEETRHLRHEVIRLRRLIIDSNLPIIVGNRSEEIHSSWPEGY